MQVGCMPLIGGSRLKPGRALKHALNCLFASLLLAGTALAAAPPAPEISPAQAEFYQASSETNRVRFLIRLSKTGMHELAAQLLQRFPLQGAHAANRTLFIEGLILEARHDNKGASRKFRDALASDPSLTLVRTELAQVLMRMDEPDSAKHHLQLLEAEAPDAQTAAGIRSFVEKIDENRPYAFSGYLSIAPSTNINNGSSHSTVYSPFFESNLAISQANKKQSGLGISAGLNVGYSKRLSDRFHAVLTGGIDATFYGDSTYDSLSTSEAAELRYILENGYVSFGGVFSQGIETFPKATAFNIKYNSYGPRLALNYQLNQRDLFKASIVDEFRDYKAPLTYDGNAIIANAAITHALDSTMNVTGFGGYEKVNTVMPSLGYTSYFGGINFYKELSGGITLDVSGQARFSTFDGQDPFAMVTRQDQRYTGSATLTKRDINLLGFAPSMTYTYSLNKSNIALFDFDSHSVNFNLTKDF
jgi:outer membrane protein